MHQSNTGIKIPQRPQNPALPKHPTKKTRNFPTFIKIKTSRRRFDRQLDSSGGSRTRQWNLEEDLRKYCGEARKDHVNLTTRVKLGTSRGKEGFAKMRFCLVV